MFALQLAPRYPDFQLFGEEAAIFSVSCSFFRAFEASTVIPPYIHLKLFFVVFFLLNYPCVAKIVNSLPFCLYFNSSCFAIICIFSIPNANSSSHLGGVWSLMYATLPLLVIVKCLFPMIFSSKHHVQLHTNKK